MISTSHISDERPGALAHVLGAIAPARVAEDVLVDTGLADRMAPMDSPLGTLWVSWRLRRSRDRWRCPLRCHSPGRAIFSPAPDGRRLRCP